MKERFEKLDNLLQKEDIDCFLIFGNSYENSDLFYLTNFLAPDAFLFFKKIGEKPILVAPSMETERANEVFDGVVKELNALSNDHDYSEAIKELSKKFDVDEFGSDYNFPLKMAKKLPNHVFKPIDVSIIRRKKDKKEVKAIEEAQKAAESAMMEVKEILTESEVRGQELVYNQETLTSEDLHLVIEKKLLEKGANCRDVIVSSGKGSAIAHNSGHGPIEPGPIIVDIFPKLKKKRYCGDITRTFCLEKKEKISDMYETVLGAQKIAFKKLKSGEKGSDIDESVKNYFKKEGYGVGKGKEKTNFIHSTGHGVGLDVHESPRISIRGDDELKKGDVITIEPGLYNPDIGGVRIEDLVLIKENGYRNLTSFEKSLYLI